MSETDNPKSIESDLENGSRNPLVFISHDSRDADIAEAFGKLIKSVSAGMIKTFRSSDKKGGDGIDFGEEWYKRLMLKLQTTSHVVCLFTEQSLERPWILFEAGVAKGRLDTPVFGVALGVPLSKITTGPFYQFQNMDDSEDDLIKLINQLGRPIPGLELDSEVIQTQVKSFKIKEAEILNKQKKDHTKKGQHEQPEDNPVAKLTEELKSLPSRITERLLDSEFQSIRRRSKRIDPYIFKEMLVIFDDLNDPIAILLSASIFRDDAPWLYELMMDVYRSIKNGEQSKIKKEIQRVRRLIESININLLSELFGHRDGYRDKEVWFFFKEFPKMLERFFIKSMTSQQKQLKEQRIGKSEENTN
jgi:hypothetical protein